MSLRSAISALVASAVAVSAHGTIPGFVTGSTWNQGFLLNYYYQKVNTGSFPSIAAWYAEDLDSGFVAPAAYGTSNINCHINAAPGALTATVAAGSTVQFQWSAWPHSYGPILTYIAKCAGDCSAADKTTLQWVKIDAVGIDYATQKWASQTLIDNNSTWTVKVPANLAAGNYVFRHEIIACHGAGSLNGAQNYPLCFNIQVTGSGTDSLPSGTLGVNLYKENDPGIYFNPYTSITSYAMPGPTLWTGGSGGGGGSSAVASTATTKQSTTMITTTKASSATSTTKAATSTTTSGSSACAALYQQCGGMGFTGATCCSSGTCKVANDYYSQCS